MATKIKGPIESLTQGIIAGRRLNALQSQVKTQRLRNELLRKDIAHADERFELDKMLRESQIADADASRSLADFNLDTARKTQASRVSTAKSAATQAEALAAVAGETAQLPLTAEARLQTESDARIADAQARTLQAGVGGAFDIARQSRSLQPDLTLEDAMADTELKLPVYSQLTGQEVKPGSAIHKALAAESFNQSSLLQRQLLTEEANTEQLGHIRLIQARTSALTADATQRRAAAAEQANELRISPGQQAVIEILQEGGKSAVRRKSLQQILSSIASTEEEKNAAQAEIDQIDRDLESLFTRLTGQSRTQPANEIVRNPDGTVKPGSVHKGTTFEGLEYIGPEPVTQESLSNPDNWKPINAPGR